MIKEGEEKKKLGCVREASVFCFMIQSKLPPLSVLPPPEVFAKQVHHVK